MKNSTLGLIVGLLLTIAIVSGGFLGFLLALVLGAVGYLVGRHLDGDVDLDAVTRTVRGRRD